MSPQTATRLQQLIDVFDKDGFHVDPSQIVPPKLINDQIGLVAEHAVAKNYGTGEAKRVFYLEGSHREMGFAMGYLAAQAVDRLATEYIDYAIWEMLLGIGKAPKGGYKPTEKEQELHDLLIEIIYDNIQDGNALANIPDALKQEVQGLVAGCAAAEIPVEIKPEDLWAINTGFDTLLAHLYALKLPKLKKARFRKLLRILLGCNALALINGASKDGALFGRDFMFPTGGVFQDLACLTIYNPQPPGVEADTLPLVSMNAPGMVGSIAAMNVNGVAAGVDVIRGANSNPDQLGINSLLLVRDAIENGSTADEAADHIVNATRGVTWLYPLAGVGRNGKKDRAGVVEAGMSTAALDYLSYPRDTVEKHLPNKEVFDKHKHTDAVLKNGAMVRWEGYEVPSVFLADYNPDLWRFMRKRLHKDAFTRLGFINRTRDEHNCPKSYYFAASRGLKGKVVIASNQCICPEMRMCSMDWWTSKLTGSTADDSQWRYDELNRRTLEALENGPISYDKAKELIDFLAPYGDHPNYYEKLPKSPDGNETVIGGSVSLFDLTHRTIESHFGYYCDDWIKLHLSEYIL